MTTLGRKLGREILHSGGLLLTIAAIIALGISCFVALSAAYANLRDAQQDYYNRTRMADFSIELKKAPLAVLQQLEQIPGVTEVRPRIQAKLTIDVPGVLTPINGQVLSLPSERKPIINDILITRGSYFTGKRPDEVIVHQAFAREHRLSPGQTLTVLLNNRRQDLFIVGTALSSEFTYIVGPAGLIPDNKNFGILYLREDYMEEVFDYEGAANQVVGLLAPELRERPQRVLEKAEQALDDHGVFTTTPRSEQPSHRFLSNEIEQLGVFALFLPAIFLAVAALVLNMLLVRLIEQQRTIIGTLKALGYTNREILTHYTLFGLVVGLAGGLLGCGLAALLSEAMTGLYRQFFEFPSLENQFRPGIYLTGIAISLACALVGTLQGTRQVLRLQPAEAMRPKPPRQGGAIVLERIGWLWNRLDTGWRMVLRNIIRNRVRTFIGIFAAAMGAALVFNTLMLNASLDYLIEFQFNKILKSDVDLAFKDEQNRNALYEAANLPGVDRAEPVLNVGCTFSYGHREKRSGITGLTPDAALSIPRDTAGNPVPIPDTGLVLGRSLADILGCEVGDVITVTPIKGLRQPHQVRVARITDGYLGLSSYANIQFLSDLIGESYALTGVQLTLNPDPEVRNEFFRELKQLPQLEGYSSRDQVVQNLEETLLETNGAAVTVVIIFAGAIFFGSTLNAAMISLAERQREVATMLVLGYTPNAISRLFWRESVTVHLLGTVVGLPLGYLLTLKAAEAFGNELARLPIVFSPWTVLAVIGISLAFHTVAHWFVRRRIVHLDWQESLKVKE